MNAKEIIKQIRKINVLRGSSKCTYINGKETPQLLIEKLLSEQGLSFAKQTNFPTIDIFREYQKECEECGIFVDKCIQARNIPLILLAGNSISELLYDSNMEVYRVYVMHGAKVKIKAANGALVSLYNISGSVDISQSNFGKIIQL